VPRLFTYVIRDDGGFAPNPFHSVCTLNCCKPVIRRVAQEGDWVAANTAANFPAGGGLLVYAMQVTRKMLMSEYDAFTRHEMPEKIPPPEGGDYRRRAGDSIYDFSGDAPIQRPGFHGPGNVASDLSGVYTLLSDHFYYFGGLPVELPRHLQPVIHRGRAHSSNTNDSYVEPFVAWITSEFESNKLYGPPRGIPQSVERVQIRRKPLG
jgi:hypothetical protein